MIRKKAKRLPKIQKAKPYFGNCYLCGKTAQLVFRANLYKEMEWCAECWEDMYPPQALIGIVRDGRNRAQGDRSVNDLTPFQWAMILKQSAGRCHYCGTYVGRAEILLDHVNPVCRGGAHTASNVVASCINCNIAKGDKTPDDWRRIKGEAQGSWADAKGTGRTDGLHEKLHFDDGEGARGNCQAGAD